MSETFTDEEIARYGHHLVLAEIGGPGQQAMKRARVLVVGAGGLGAPALLYLAAAGIGTLGILDDDHVSLSNLQRQVIHSTNAVGQAKTSSAAASIAAVNPHVQVVQHRARLDADNAAAFIRGYDLVLDGSDNFATRYAVADACEAERKPLVTGSVGRFDGSVTVLVPFEAGDGGKPNPSWRDLFPEQPPDGLVPSCAETGIVGALTGVIGSMMALEAIKCVTGAGEPLVGRLLLYDGLAGRTEIVRYGARRPAEPRAA